MKSIIVALLASTSIQALACVPSITKDVLLKIVQPGRKTVTLTYGGTEFLYSEMIMRAALEENEEVQSVSYDSDLLSDEVVMSSSDVPSNHFNVFTIQLKKAESVYSGKTDVVLSIKNKKTKKSRTVKQTVEVNSLPSLRGC